MLGCHFGEKKNPEQISRGFPHMVIASNSRPVTGMPPTEQESWKVGLLQRRSSHCLLNRKSQGFQRNTDNVVLSTPTSGPLVSSCSLCAELPSVPQKHKQSQGALPSNPTARKEMGGLCIFYEVWVSGFFSMKIWSSIKFLASVERERKNSEAFLHTPSPKPEPRVLCHPHTGTGLWGPNAGTYHVLESTPLYVKQEGKESRAHMSYFW